MRTRAKSSILFFSSLVLLPMSLYYLFYTTVTSPPEPNPTQLQKELELLKRTLHQDLQKQNRTNKLPNPLQPPPQRFPQAEAATAARESVAAVEPRADGSVQTDRKQLMLMTYGRTGSSYTSAIISHDPSVFFAHEPLHGLPRDIYSENMLNTTRQQAIDTIDAFLNCNFLKIDPEIFQSLLFENSHSTIETWQCLKYRRHTGYKHVHCFIKLWQTCLEHKTSFVKTIRFRRDWTELFLKNNPNLKILFLVRDFRGMLYSQSKNFETFDINQSAKHYSKRFCDLAMADWQELLRLKSLYPGRIKSIRYEDGCIDPTGYAEEIYQFAGLKLSDTVTRYVERITSSRRHIKNQGYSVEKSDPVKAMNAWRKSINYDTVKEMDSNCGEAYKVFGYKPVNSMDELRAGDTFSLVTDPSSEGKFLQD